MTDAAVDRTTTRAVAGTGLVVDGLTKAYGANEVLSDLSLSVAPGEFVCIVGPSGVGKSTLLRCLAGLARPTAGEVRLGDRPVTEPPEEIALVFQDYSRSLLPWMRAGENVALPLQGKGVRRRERTRRAAEALVKVGLAHAVDQHPWQLSGGMQQRVAIARALAYESEILLMDEPFASVDAQTRIELEDLVAELRVRFGMTIVLVTHDIDEAVYLGDRIVVLGGSPATVVDVVETGFGPERDQMTTKADPRFAEHRNRILGRIRR